MSAVARLRAGARRALGNPVHWTESIQLAKTVAAALVAWVLAAEVFQLPQAFLAPWSALLVVHATVYRTFSRGLQQVTAAVLGVLLAWVVGNTLGLNTLAMAALLSAGLLVGAVRWFREESTAVAATALIVLTTGISDRGLVLVDRLFDTAIGIVVGLVVNLAVWPPLRDYSAAQAIGVVDDHIGDLLRDMAEELRRPCTGDDVDAWIGRTETIDEQIDHSWSLVRQARESSWLNPRPAAAAVRRGEVFDRVLRDDEQAVAEARSVARTLGHTIEQVHEWDAQFRDRWLALLQETGEAISASDATRLGDVRTALNRLTVDLGTADLPNRHWPEYGALIVNLRTIATVMERVSQEPLGVPRYAARRTRVPSSLAARVRGLDEGGSG